MIHVGDKVYITTSRQVGTVVDANLFVGGKKCHRVRGIGVVPDEDLQSYRIYDIEETPCYPCSWHVMDGTNDNFFRTPEEAMDYVVKFGDIGKIIYKNGETI
jgi:hypothetical protein